MRRANQADYLNRPSERGVLDHDAAWLLAGIEPTDIPAEDREIPLDSRELLAKQTRRMWAGESNQVTPEHLRDAVELAASIMRLIRADQASGEIRRIQVDPATGVTSVKLVDKGGDLPKGESSERPCEERTKYTATWCIERPWEEWIRWARAKRLELPQALLDAMSVMETPQQRRIRIALQRRELKARGVHDYTRQIAEREGLSLTQVKDLAREGDKLLLADNATNKKRK